MFEHEIIRLKKRIHKHQNKEGLVVFYGSSSIRLWVNIKKDLEPVNVMNLGFGGSSFEWLNNYFGELFEEIKPDHIFIYGGDNDLSHGVSPVQISQGFKKLIEKIYSRTPNTTVHGISVKPSPSRMRMIDKIEETNELIERVLIQNNYHNFIDIFRPMIALSKNGLEELYMKDQLHMNKKGYAIWREVVRDYLNKKGLLVEP